MFLTASAASAVIRPMPKDPLNEDPDHCIGIPLPRSRHDAGGRPGYETGRVGFLNWLDAERIFLPTNLSYYRAAARYLKAMAQIERAVGKEVFICKHKKNVLHHVLVLF